MNGEQLMNNISGDLIVQECSLCGKTSNSCVDILTIQEVISIKFINENIGLKFNEDDVPPNLLCDVCIQQITSWQNFIHSCLDVQKDRERYLFHSLRIPKVCY